MKKLVMLLVAILPLTLFSPWKRLLDDENMTEADIQALALNDEKVKTALGGSEPKKVIVIPGRVVNIVL